jgi:hypothetical protein
VFKLNVEGDPITGLESLSSAQAANNPTLSISSIVDFNIVFIIINFLIVSLVRLLSKNYQFSINQ